MIGDVMSTMMARYEQRVRENCRNRPELIEPLLMALAAYDRLKSGTVPDRFRADLDLIRQTASDRRRPLYDMATQLLAEIAEISADARAAIELMMQAPQSHIRFNGIVSLSAEAPRDFSQRVIAAGLRDKSIRVRKKAADWAYRMQLLEAIPDLAEAYAIESNSKLRDSMEFYLRMLRDGYVLKHEGTTTIHLTIAFGRGGICSCRISEAELTMRGVEEIVRRKRHELENRGY